MRVVGALVALAFGQVAVPFTAPSYASSLDPVRAEVKDGVLMVEGTPKRDELRFARHPLISQRLTITIGDENLWSFEFDRSEFDRISVRAGDGNDFIRVDERWGSFTDEKVEFFGDSGQDLLRGGSGDDYLSGGRNHDLLDGNGGNDVLSGGTTKDNVYGGDGDDVLLGGGGPDLLIGEAGDDRLSAGTGRDHVFGFEGDDVLRGGGGDDYFDGHEGNDRLFGGRGHDLMKGSGGDDELRGEGGYDDLQGDKGEDLIDGGVGKDLLRARDGDSDRLFGGPGTDRARPDHALDLVREIEFYF